MSNRLTARDGILPYFPECFQEPCNGTGCKQENCKFLGKVCEKLADYEDTYTLTPGERVYIHYNNDYFGYVLLMYNQKYALLSPTIDKENDLDALCKTWSEFSKKEIGGTLIVPRDKLLTEAEVKEKEGNCLWK